MPALTLIGRGVLNKPAAVADESRPDPGQKAGTVTSAMAILRLLSNAERPLGVNAIARTLALAPSSCFKILKSLVAEEFVEFDTHTKGYTLGHGTILIARRALDPFRAFAAVRPRLEATAAALGIGIGLWRIIPNARMVLIGFVEGSSQMRIHMSIGQRVPMLVGAVGRANAAQLKMPVEVLKAQFDAMRWQTPLSFPDYQAQVEQAKSQGYGMDEENFAVGVHTVGISITDHTGAIRYGLSGIMFSGQHDLAARRRIALELMDVADWVSGRLVD